VKLDFVPEFALNPASPEQGSEPQKNDRQSRLGFSNRVYDGVDSRRQAIPFSKLMLALRPAGLCQRVELRLPAGFGFGPLSLDPAVLLQPL